MNSSLRIARLPRGEQHPHWSGGRTRDRRGYVLVLRQGHPRAHKRGYVYEHILVAEEMLGRAIGPSEHVHHRNGVHDDNRAENLEVLDRGDHFRHHLLRYRKEVLLEAIRWLALKLGHTPPRRAMDCADLRAGSALVRDKFGTFAAACIEAGLVPNPEGGFAPRSPLPHGFAEKHAELRSYASLADLFQRRFGGLLTDHERHQVDAEVAQNFRQKLADAGDAWEDRLAGVGHRGTTAAEVME